MFAKFKDVLGTESTCVVDALDYSGSTNSGGSNAPTLTTVSKFSVNEDSPLVISYSDLIAAADEADTDGDIIQFEVAALTSGSLTTDGSTAVAVGARLNNGEQWIWQAASNASGNDIQGFTILAWDGSAQSSNPVPVSFDVAAANDAPTLTNVNDFAATEDTALTISYADLIAAANEADADGDSLQFELAASTSGSLTSDGSTPVNVGDRLNTGQLWIWQPSTNASGNDVQGFTILAWDGSAHSTSAVPVRFDVATVNDTPTLTSINDFAATEDTALTITYANLIAAANEADVDGDVIQFQLVSATSGSLTTDGSSSVNVGDRLATGQQWIWQPGANANGSDVQGFTVNAWDGTANSAVAVPVRFDITAVNDAPTLTSVSDFSVNEDTDLTITYANLMAAANEADVDGDTLSFELAALTSGNLTTDGSSAVSVGDRLSTGGQWVWRGASNASGNDTQGFTILAWDGAANSASAIPVRFDITPVNDTPTFTSISDFATGVDTAHTITYSNMANNANEADPDGDTVQFELVSLSSGTLTTDGSTTVNVGDRLNTGGQWVWLPASAASGSDIAAFTIRAWDGTVNSSGSVSVLFNVGVSDNPPTPGASGTITTSSVTVSSMTLSWTKATDDNDAQASLNYCVYRSSSAMASVAAAEAQTLVGSCAADIDSISDSSLTATTDYYYNVVVQDTGGNKAVYSSLYAPTAAAFHLVYNSYITSTDNRIKYATDSSGSVVVNNVHTVNDRVKWVDFEMDSSDDLHILLADETVNRYYVTGNVSGGFTADTLSAVQVAPQDEGAIAVEGDGTVHMIFMEEWTSGPNKERTLFYSTGTTSSWTSERLTQADPSNDIGWGPDIYVDSSSIAHFTFLDESAGEMIYGYGTSGSFIYEVIEAVGSVDLGYTRLEEADDGTLHVVYWEDTTNHIYYETNAGGWGSTRTTAVSNIDIWESNFDMALDSSDYVHICYRNSASGDTHYATNASGSWVSEVVYTAGEALPSDSEGCGTCSIDVGSKLDRVHISYYTNCSTRSIRHKYGSAGSWTDMLIDSNGESYNDNLKLIVD